MAFVADVFTLTAFPKHLPTLLDFFNALSACESNRIGHQIDDWELSRLRWKFSDDKLLSDILEFPIKFPLKSLNGCEGLVLPSRWLVFQPIHSSERFYSSGAATLPLREAYFMRNLSCVRKLYLCELGISTIARTNKYSTYCALI